MAKKNTPKPKTQVKKPAPKRVEEPKPITLEEKQKTFEGDLLGDKYDVEYLKRNGLYGHTCHRRMRYWCYKFRNEVVEDRTPPPAPGGLKEFIESLPGFAGWKYFAVSWDIWGENPFMVVLRLQSVWEEWDQVMQRVSIPIDTPPEQLHERLQALSDEYARKQLKRN